MNDNALIAMASVSAVLWTGGLIVKQLERSTTALSRNLSQLGIEYVAFSFFAPLAALMMDRHALQETAIVIGSLYFWVTIYRVISHQRYDERSDVVSPEERFERWYTFWQMLPLFGEIAVALKPSTHTVLWASIILVFFGYQCIMGHLTMIRFAERSANSLGSTSTLPISQAGGMNG